MQASSRWKAWRERLLYFGTEFVCFTGHSTFWAPRWRNASKLAANFPSVLAGVRVSMLVATERPTTESSPVYPKARRRSQKLRKNPPPADGALLSAARFSFRGFRVFTVAHVTLWALEMFRFREARITSNYSFWSYERTLALHEHYQSTWGWFNFPFTNLYKI